MFRSVICFTASECDSESEREWACPAKRRRRERPSSAGSTDSLSRSSSLAQFESLERSCAAPASPSLSPDSLDSPPPSPRPAHRPPAPRAHLSAENLSEDSGYSERPRRPPPPPARTPRDTRPQEIARRSDAASAPCLVARVPSPERRPRRAARSLSLPAELDLCVADSSCASAHRAPDRRVFAQTFELCDSLTVSVADLTALDYRGGARRPRLPPPPPPPPRTRRPPPPSHPAPPPPLPSPPREPSTSSDSTTESERAFAREMEDTARQLDETARRALADVGDFDRELSVLTAQRLRGDAWGAWDDVLDELRRRTSRTSPAQTPSPPPEPLFSSTPVRAGDARVRSTPELRARTAPRRTTPDELRASLQHVPLPEPPPPGRCASSGSRGVTFSPVVAEVSWREASAGTDTESAPSASTSDDATDAEVTVVGSERGSSRLERDRVTDRRADMQETGARAPPRGRIAGFLSRFANFRFSGRKGEKKSRGAGATPRAGGSAAEAPQSPRAAAASAPVYVRIPLKEEVHPGAGGAGPAHRPPRHRAPPAPAPGVLETDVDTQRTVLHARSLLALAPAGPRPPRPHKSMEFLLDKESAEAVQVSVV